MGTWHNHYIQPAKDRYAAILGKPILGGVRNSSGGFNTGRCEVCGKGRRSKEHKAHQKT